ncbi:hypothetical protein M501DRAFT_930413 [Patellaria atrata CBS 101060]|uniref:YCII-related domain-containing protein n=1 Tax=Patellaria atrata CBS 101060 TaxID=1346257 RepID=A0A9P4SDS1_9PEZI|nr:hypothetical protein M501DRAFT_930413 [Patellaria atrata CBS 101060]
MADSPAPKKTEWLVILPDQEGGLERRLKVRQQHLSELPNGVDEDFWLFGGAFLESPPVEGETPKMKGSVMLAQAESKEALLKRLKEDVYTTGEVWDWDKVTVYPFKSALRKAL